MRDDLTSTIPKSAAGLLIDMVKPMRLRVLGFFFFSFLGVLSWTAAPFAISLIITHLSHNSHLDAYVWRLVIIYIALRWGDELFWRFAEYIARSFKPQMVESVRTRLFTGVLEKPHGFYVNASSGRIAHWINNVTEMVNEFADITLWTVWGQLLDIVLSAIFLAFVHWSLALLFAVWMVLLFWFNMHRGKQFAKMVKAQSDETSIASGMVVDAVSNHTSVRIFNARGHERQRLIAQQGKIIKNWRLSWGQNLVTNMVKGWSAAAVSALALILALELFSHGSVSLGGIVLFTAYFGAASTGLWQLAWALDTYYRNLGTIQNGLNGLTAATERQGEAVLVKHLPKRVAVTLDHVRFAYPDQPENFIIDNVSLEIASGQKVGFVGHSGAGKSTLIGLLLNFYEVTDGKILINADDIGEKDPSFVRAISSFVPQDTSLFNRTIKENVLYARPDATEAEVKHALEKAEAWEFVKKLPQGLDTLIGERGVKLSGGQRQRIAIARAILKDAPLLLLDEATSALDSISEQAIQKSLHTLMQDRTALVIAHRLSTLKHLDKIVVIDKGKIAEQGTHDELVKQDGIYADLWRRQKDGFIVE